MIGDGTLAATLSNGAKRHPILTALALGLVLRTTAAFIGWGWFAIDDYLYVVEPAWRWLEEPSWPYPSLRRSPLLAHAFHGLMSAAQSMGATDPRTVLQIAYFGLGLWSLLAIPAAFLLAKRLGDRTAAIAALLIAVHPLMPRISTRALIEVVAIVPLVWSLTLIERSVAGSLLRKLSMAIGGGLLFGLAVMLRFQVGVMAIAITGWLLWHNLRHNRQRRGEPGAFAPFIGFALAGIVAVTAQGGLDVVHGRPFFSTMLWYVGSNLDSSDSFGASSWYTYLWHLLALTVPPATVLLAKPLWRAARSHALVSLCLAVFVLAHTLVPHKEDRFMFPILPLALVLLAAALVDLHRGGRWERWTVRFFWAFNVVALVVATTSDAHRNLTTPLAAIGRLGGTYEVAVVGSRQVPDYYLGSSSRAQGFAETDLFVDAVITGKLRPDFVLFRPEPNPYELEVLRNLGLQCRGPTMFPGDLVDRVLVVLNPRHNERRHAVALFDCRPKNRGDVGP